MPLMALTNGTKLGPYEIVAPLGSGGMGEVYRARDTRLGRIVAVKILPSHLSDNSTLRQRFEQEAKAISSLNHPHICILHDVLDIRTVPISWSWSTSRGRRSQSYWRKARCRSRKY